MKIQFAFRNFANALKNLRPVPLPRFKPSISRPGNLTNQMLLRVVWFKRAQNSFSGGKAADGVKLVTHIRLRLDHCMAFSPLKRKVSQTSVHERLGSRTIRFTNKFSEHKASRMTYCVSSYEHSSRQNVDKNKSQWTTFSETEAQWV